MKNSLLILFSAVAITACAHKPAANNPAEAGSRATIDEVQFDDALADHFAKFDRDDDGYLAADEAGKKCIQGADRSRDGKVSIVEFMATSPQRFKAVDSKKRDGVLQGTEIQAALQCN